MYVSKGDILIPENVLQQLEMWRVEKNKKYDKKDLQEEDD
jgi:hypothetical protein